MQIIPNKSTLNLVYQSPKEKTQNVIEFQIINLQEYTLKTKLYSFHAEN